MSTLINHFNWIDVIALLLLLRLGYMGIRQGLSEELIKLTGVLVGLFVGFRWYQYAGDWVAGHTTLSHEWAGAAMLVVLVLIPYLVTGLLLRLLQKLVTLQFAQPVNQAGGAVASVARAGLVMSIVLVTLQQLPSDYLRASIEERSFSGRYVARWAPAVYDAINPWMTQHLPGTGTMPESPS